MNPRERLLMIGLVAVVGGGGVLLGTYQWFVKPLREVNKQIAEMRDKRDELHELHDQFERDREKMKIARTRSMPASASNATFEYMTVYLQPLLNASGMKEVTVQRTQAGEQKFTPTIPGVKKVGHQVLTFSVRAKGDLVQLVQVLDQMQHAPFEHRIKSLSMDRADISASSKDRNPRLNINMVIETLVLTKSETKPGMPPGFDANLVILDHFAARQDGIPLGLGLLALTAAKSQEVLQPKYLKRERGGQRNYEEITYQNIFTGYIPYVPPPPPRVVKEPPPPPPPPPIEPKLNVPAYVRLVQTSPNLHEAYLRNIVYRSWSEDNKSQELKVIAKPESGYEHFQIIDQDTGYLFFRAKVLKVDSRGIFFQVRRLVYEWEIGQSLADALTNNHVSVLHLDVMDIEVDEQFAAAEIARDKEKEDTENGKKTPAKKTTPKAPTKGK